MCQNENIQENGEGASSGTPDAGTGAQGDEIKTLDDVKGCMINDNNY